MKIDRFKALDDQEIKTIHRHTLEVLSEVGIKVELKKLRNMLQDLGCRVNPTNKQVQFSPDFVESYLRKAPREFILCGADPDKQWKISPAGQIFGGLGTLINIYDLETGQYRPTTVKPCRINTPLRPLSASRVPWRRSRPSSKAW